MRRAIRTFGHCALGAAVFLACLPFLARLNYYGGVGALWQISYAEAAQVQRSYADLEADTYPADSLLAEPGAAGCVYHGLGVR